MNKLISIYSSAYAAIISIVFVTAMTIGAELSAPFKAWLAGFTGHHWVTKSWVSMIVFILCFWYLKLTKKTISDPQTKKALDLLNIYTILGAIIILGFYLYEFFNH